MTCGLSGAIPAVIAAMSSHGAASVAVSEAACIALMKLTVSNSPNADAVLQTPGGLDGILSAMAAHAYDAYVQQWACAALWRISTVASPAALALLREGRVIELVNTAKRCHFSCRGLIKYADDFLAALK